MTDEQFFTEMCMQLVQDRLFNLAVTRTLRHREFENGSHFNEAARAETFDFKEAMHRVENLPGHTPEEWDTLKSSILAMAEEGGGDVTL